MALRFVETTDEVYGEMPELLRSIAARLREIVNNRRRAPRYKTRLEVTLGLSAFSHGGKTHVAGAAGRPQQLAGLTWDVSETGLAVIVPAIRIGGQYLTDQDCTLQIVLQLPTGPVEIHAAPARYSPFDEGEDEVGYLIGLHIKQMSDGDRTRFRAYIKTLGKG